MIARSPSASGCGAGVWRLVLGQAADGKPLYEVADNTVTLNFHDGQRRTWESQARTVAMIAGSQGGKTSFDPWWLYREIFGDGFDFVGHGKGDYLAVTASYDLFKLKLLPEMRGVFEHVLQVGRYWSGDKVIELADPQTGQFHANRADDPMWARIILRSAASPGGLESASAKAAVLDEAGQDDFTLEAKEAVDRRLTLNRGRRLITTTPYNLGWLKQQIVDKADGVNIEVINFESVANPAFSAEEFEHLRTTLSSWKFNMFHRGLYDRPPGMIYKDFVDEYRERGGHKIKPFDMPAKWTRYVGVDPGVIHFCDVWIAHDPERDVAYIYRESIRERKSTSEQATDLLKLSADNHEYVGKWAVGAKSEIYHREDFILAGAETVVEPPYSDVEVRIDAVIARLRASRLFIFDTCTGVLDQIGTYARVVDALGNTTEKIKDKEKYHYLDALGYGVLALPTTADGAAEMGDVHYADNFRFSQSDY